MMGFEPPISAVGSNGSATTMALQPGFFTTFSIKELIESFSLAEHFQEMGDTVSSDQFVCQAV